jgi:hypothetical protein
MLKEYQVIDGEKSTNMQGFPFLTASFETELYIVDVTSCIVEVFTLHCV